jgi:hypothetical protein
MTDNQARRIVILVDHVESHYHQEIVRGALRAARASRVRCLIVAGGWLGKPPEAPVLIGLAPKLAKSTGETFVGG